MRDFSRRFYETLLGWTLHLLGSWVGFWASCGLLWGALILFVTATERAEYGAAPGYGLPIGVAILGGLAVALHRTFAGFPRPGKSR